MPSLSEWAERTPDTLADAWPTSVGAELQTVGVPAPNFPEA